MAQQHLVFQTAFPGDLFLSVPLMKRIKEWDPSAHLVLACRPGLGEFFLASGLADEVIHIDKKDGKQMAAAMQGLRRRSWDVVFVPHQSVRTALMISRLRAKHKVGFAKWWNALFFDKRVDRPVDFPDALRQLSLLTPLDARLAELFGQEETHELRNLEDKKDSVDYRAPVIPEWASMKIMSVKPQGKTVFMAPGSTWNTKRWTPEGYTALGRLISAQGYEITLVGSKDEGPLCQEIAAALARGGVNARDMSGRTSLKDLVQLLRTGTALITNDSGSMHAAALSALPTVAIFGPTTLNLGFRPWNNKAIVVQRDLACRPCGKHGHERCPLGHHHCMERIEAAEVFRAFRGLIAADENGKKQQEQDGKPLA